MSSYYLNFIGCLSEGLKISRCCTQANYVYNRAGRYLS